MGQGKDRPQKNHWAEATPQAHEEEAQMNAYYDPIDIGIWVILIVTLAIGAAIGAGITALFCWFL